MNDKYDYESVEDFYEFFSETKPDIFEDIRSGMFWLKIAEDNYKVTIQSYES